MFILYRVITGERQVWLSWTFLPCCGTPQPTKTECEHRNALSAELLRSGNVVMCKHQALKDLITDNESQM